MMPRYFLSILFYFWIPVLVMGGTILPRQDLLSRKAFWRTVLFLYCLTTLTEYVYLYYDIWTFSEKLDPLLGPRVFGAPIEEFWFYYGAVPFALLVYMTFDLILKPRPLPGISLRRRPALRPIPPPPVVVEKERTLVPV